MISPRLVFRNGTLPIPTRAMIMALFGAAFATAAVAQNFIPGPGTQFRTCRQGPKLRRPANGTVGGAIQAVLPDPVDASTMFPFARDVAQFRNSATTR